MTDALLPVLKQAFEHADGSSLQAEQSYRPGLSPCELFYLESVQVHPLEWDEDQQDWLSCPFANQPGSVSLGQRLPAVVHHSVFGCFGT